jgi:hypothetical protein
MFLLFAVLVLSLSLLAVAPLVAHPQCDVGPDPNDPQEINHKGDEHQNDCAGGNGKDDMFGFQNDDILGGGPGEDRIRGNSQDDRLTDNQGDGDWDRFCDGDGSDHIEMIDGDGMDHWHKIGDGESDGVVKNPGDTFEPDDQVHLNCPMAD